jgi:hypothetical protein
VVERLSRMTIVGRSKRWQSLGLAPPVDGVSLALASL